MPIRVRKYTKWTQNSLFLREKFTEWTKLNSLSVLEIYEILAQSIDFVNKMKYNEYTNIDKLIYQIN